MSSHSTDTADLEETYGPDESDAKSEPRRLLAGISAGVRNGTLPMLAGSVLLADAARTAGQSRRRAGLCAFAGGALLGVGLRQRGSSGDSSTTASDGPEGGEYADTESIGIDDDASEIADEARAHRERSDVLHESETNPRGVSGEPDVETETDPDEGDVQFTTDRNENAAPKPHLEGSTEDPRRSDEDPEADDDHVEVDLSEAAMADEASEATGPDPEQAYPSLEGTDPEPMGDEAPPRGNEGAVSSTESASDDEPSDGNQTVTDESETDTDDGT